MVIFSYFGKTEWELLLVIKFYSCKWWGESKTRWKKRMERKVPYWHAVRIIIWSTHVFPGKATRKEKENGTVRGHILIPRWRKKLQEIPKHLLIKAQCYKKKKRLYYSPSTLHPNVTIITSIASVPTSNKNLSYPSLK